MKERTHARTRHWATTFILVACVAVAQAQPPRGERVIERSEGWELVQYDDPFADQPRRCEIRSVTDGGSSGRRPRPRFRVVQDEGRVYVDPTVMLSQAVRLGRQVIDSKNWGYRREGKRFEPPNELTQRLRVDEGQVYSVIIKDPEFAPWPAHKSMDDVGAFLESMRRGGTIHYGWSLDKAGETFSVDLKGFGEISRLETERCGGRR